MAIDRVHDLQQVYRKLVHSMSRPGTISTIEQQTQNVEGDCGCSPALLVSAMTLLDAEVTFHVLAPNRKELIEKISAYTSARYTTADQADFILVVKSVKKEEILDALQQCKIGHLIDPHQSATWLIESQKLMNEGPIQLKGPGIQTNHLLQTGHSTEFWKARKNRTQEYPMGIDMIFLDEYSQLACVPRTVSVISMEGN